MEVFYLLFSTIFEIFATIGMLGSFWAFYAAWRGENNEFKRLGWALLIFAVVAAVLAFMFSLL